MKNTLGMFAMLLPAALLTIYPNNLNAVQDDDKEKPWQCKGNCRTWVVIDSDETHMAKGDKFQIQKSSSEVKFVALSQLRGRWKKAALTPTGFGLTRIGPPGKYTAKTRFCGFIDVDADLHKNNDIIGHGKDHMFKIKLKGENLLQITWSAPPPSSEKTQVEKCEALDDSHGGIVHAEPN